MVSISAEIKTIADENAAIIGRVEAKKDVQRRIHSVETGQKDGRMWFKVSEHVQSEDAEAYRKQWKFTETFQQDFPRCIGGDLKWSASSWDEIKQLNVGIKDVAASLIDTFFRQEDAEWEPVIKTCEAVLQGYLENVKSIKKALSSVEADTNGESRRDQLQQDFDAVAVRASDIMTRGDFRPVPMLFKGSSILRHRMKEQQQLLSWYPAAEWKLIYKGSEHGMSASAFHAHADGKGPTITIIQSGENIFGGYTQLAWKTSGNWIQDATASVFLLQSSLKIEPARFPVLNNGQNAVLHHQAYGATFGQGHDLRCFNGNGDSCSNLGRCYENRTEYGAYVLTGGQEVQFTPSEVEVFERVSGGSGAATA